MNLLIARLTNLTMSLERTRTEPNDKQIEGVTLSIKVLTSFYPYITGWSLSKEHQKYSTFYINLMINEDIFLKYHKKPYYYKRDNSPEYIYLKNVFSTYDYDKMNSRLNVFYQQLPEELQMFNVWTFTSTTPRVEVELVRLELDVGVIEVG